MLHRIFILTAVLVVAVTANVMAMQQQEATNEHRKLSKLLALAQEGKATPADLDGIKRLAVTVLSQSESDDVQPTFGQYDLAGCGSGPANWVKNEFSALDPADPQAAPKFEGLVDAYWTDPNHQWCSPDGRQGTGWGQKGLSYFETAACIKTYKKLLGAGVQFSPVQAGKLEAVWVDALKSFRDGKFYYYGPCNGWNGRTNIDDGCGEDDASIIRSIALGWNTFPDATNSVLSDEEILALLKKFFDKLTSTDYANGGDLMTDEQGNVWLPNHGGPNVPYSLIALIEVRQAWLAFIETGKVPPEFLKSDVLLAMFHWCQKHALEDGSAFTSDCYRNSDPQNATLPCNDPGVADAVPTILPGGNYIDPFWGDGGFLPGKFRFTTCDLSLVNKQGNFDEGRADEFCRWNPGRINLSLLTVFTPPSFLDLKWLVPDNMGAVTFDVWDLNGRVAQGLGDDAFTFSNMPCGAFGFSVYVVSGGQIVGGDWGTTQVNCSHMVRKHLRGIHP
jgi:hypothetical protein